MGSDRRVKALEGLKWDLRLLGVNSKPLGMRCGDAPIIAEACGLNHKMFEYVFQLLVTIESEREL